MAPTTRSKLDLRTPPKRPKQVEATTIGKTTFFLVWDDRPVGEGRNLFCDRTGYKRSTTTKWLKQREVLGPEAYRRTRPRSERLGKPSRMSDTEVQALLDPKRNPYYKQRYECMIEKLSLPIQERQLKRRLTQSTNNAQRYKAATFKDDLSDRVKDLRQEYGKYHETHTVDNYWRWVVLTDEMHIDPTTEGDDYVLREEGTRYDLENIVPRSPTTGIRFHIAGWANWYEKCLELEFYNDEELDKEFEHAQEAAEEAVEEDHGPRPKKPRRRPKTETTEQFEQRLAEYHIEFTEWEANSPPQPIVAGKGNSMTQAYYTKRLLPVYIQAIKNLQSKYGHSFLLLEDGDPSHGMKKAGLAQRLRDTHGIQNVQHPPQSPDLNPIEACWNILKQRLRTIPDLHRLTIEQFKKVANDAWRDITMEEVRSRVGDMPGRCKTLGLNGGNRIKEGKW
jgi:hypothetical protein